MPAPVIVPEDPANDFTFSDWQELMAVADPSGADVLGIDNSEATLVGQIPANKARSAFAFFRGYSYADKVSPFRMHRKQPARHPVWSWLYVRSAQFHRAHPTKDATTGAPNVPAVDPSTITKTGKYGKVWVSLSFGPYPYALYDDSDTYFQNSLGGYEWERNCNIYKSTEPNLETISASTGRYLKFVEGPPGGPPQKDFPSDVVEYKITTNLTLAWDNVPIDFVYTTYLDLFQPPPQTGLGFPKKIIPAVGHVNLYPFLGWAPGTLLCYPPRFRKYTQPVRTVDGQGYPAIDVELNFGAFDPTPGAPRPRYRGWQLLPWVDSSEPSGTTTTAGGPGWFSAERPDGSPLLPRYDFSKMFTHVLAP